MKPSLIILQRNETKLFRTQLNQQVSEAISNQIVKQKYKIITHLACEFEIIVISINSSSIKAKLKQFLHINSDL